MKTFLKILLGIVGAIVIAISAVFFFTSDMVVTADEFFVAVKNKDMDKALAFLSEDFKSGTSKDALQKYLENNSINNFKDASWESRSINNGRGNLVGSITTESGGVVPISLSFVKGDNGWKIYSIQKPSPGIQEDSTQDQMPLEQEMVRLVADSMHVFAESVNEKSMVKFHSHVSNMWQQQITPNKFDEVFAAFYDAGVNLTVLDNYSPQFSGKPNIDENGVLVIAGLYPTKPNQVHFEHQYIYEGLGWKLMGFSTNIK